MKCPQRYCFPSIETTECETEDHLLLNLQELLFLSACLYFFKYSFYSEASGGEAGDGKETAD